MWTTREMKPARRSAFTLTELLVVIGIVVLLALAAVPAINQMWEQRKISEAETILRGALMNARQRALGTTEAGLLFYLDGAGVQHVVLIQRADEPLSARYDEGGNPKYTTVDPLDPSVRVDLISSSRFEIVPGVQFTIPKPIRAAPSAALLDPARNARRDRQLSFERFSDAELVNNDFDAPVGLTGQEEFEPQRHRNYFAVVFSPLGQQLIGRDVLVYDEDGETDLAGSAGYQRGDLTGVRAMPMVTKYAAGSYDPVLKEMPRELDPSNRLANLAHMLTVRMRGEDVAVNFPSVRGVIVYDDEQFQQATPGTHRQYLRETARPYYVSATTGDVIRGPIGSEAQ
ncbi:MAG: hypothetical protein BroJett003_01880 [Planctomycetota bacterium]|nr:MAG: hypothetical protein BroJett003_01880 [Planctomycetota bacterium]